MKRVGGYEAYCASRGLIPPAGLLRLSTNAQSKILDGLIYRPDLSEEEPTSLAWAQDLLDDAFLPPPGNLVPILPVDDASLACVVCCRNDHAGTEETGKVVRWHLGEIEPKYQGALLDDDVASYVRSVKEEHSERTTKIAKVKSVSENYKKKFVDAGRRPSGWQERPVQLACQNVIIGLASFCHDSSFDGLRVMNYVTCEAPHLATHEGNRAMMAMALCDAFQNGGTMELRFGPKGREEKVPPGLLRFGRSLGIKLGVEDSKAIAPSESRTLFLAVTPMPDGLKARALDLIDRGAISPERLCYTLQSSVWRAIELDYILATSSRSGSILRGGASFNRHFDRLPELEVSRAAVLIGMLFRRLENDDVPDGSGTDVRVFEDNSSAIEWSIDSQDAESGVVAMASVPTGLVSWSAPGREPVAVGKSGGLLVVPRGLPTPKDFQLIADLQAISRNGAVALLSPVDMADVVPSDIPLLLCPDRLGELDVEIEKRLLRLRLGRS